MPSDVQVTLIWGHVIRPGSWQCRFCHLATALHSYIKNSHLTRFHFQVLYLAWSRTRATISNCKTLYKKRAEEKKEILKCYIQVSGIKDVFGDLFRMELDERETMGVKTADLGKVSFFLRKADRSHESWTFKCCDRDITVVEFTETTCYPSHIGYLLLAIEETVTKCSSCQCSALTVESLATKAQTLLSPGTTLLEEFEHTVGEVYVMFPSPRRKRHLSFFA